MRANSKNLWLTAAAIVLSLVTTGEAKAAAIQYVATNLADTTPGQDLWRFDYTIAGRSFLQSQFVDIYFDPLLYSSLTAAPTPNPDWDVAILQQPNPLNLPPFNVGIFDMFALVDNASLAGEFSVTFVYSGPGTPGSQPFDVFDASGAVLESSFTSPVTSGIPEPSTCVTVSTVLAVLILGSKRFRRL